MAREAVENVARELEHARDQLSDGDYAYLLKRVRKLVDEERDRIARAVGPIAGQLSLDEKPVVRPSKARSQMTADDPDPDWGGF